MTGTHAFRGGDAGGDDHRHATFLNGLEGVLPKGTGWIAKCPAHEDKTPSLSITVGEDGKLLVHCHAGCAIEKILAARGMEWDSLFAQDNDGVRPPRSARRNEPRRYSSADEWSRDVHDRLGGTLTSYDYFHATGDHCMRVARVDYQDGRKKEIRQARREGDSWLAKAIPSPRPLYRLPELLAAALDDVVLVVEGEKCVGIARSLGFTATTSSGGSQCAAKTDWSPVADRGVVLVPDDDPPGQQYSSEVGGLARAAGASSVSLLELDGLPPGGDIADWVEARERSGMSKEAIAEELLGLVATARVMPTESSPGAEAAEHPNAGDWPWPAPMSADVRVGLLGEFLDLVTEQTEADPAAIAVDFLVRVGNSVGRGPHFTVSGDRHGCNLFMALIGDTAQGRKGSSAAYPREIMKVADPTWSQKCTKQGLSSGEGVIWSVRDKSERGVDKKTKKPVYDEGVADKRLLVVETEMARTLRSSNRRENTLAPILRQAWEGGGIASMTKEPYGATDAHVSIIAHVTKAEFTTLLSDQDIAGGTVNRFLLIGCKRQRELPFGGQVDAVKMAVLAGTLRDRIEAARQLTGEFEFSNAAREVWPGIYSGLLADEKAPGMAGQLLGRAVVQVRRLAMILAIIDGASTVGTTHLDAALEVWRYSRATVRYVFGAKTGNQIADRILAELVGCSQGLDRTDLHRVFKNHLSGAEIDGALTLLRALRLAFPVLVPTAGRTREIWMAVR